jgi:hypothetical protein
MRVDDSWGGDKDDGVGHVQRSSLFRLHALFHLETDSPSPHETTLKARAPRPNRRGELRCTTASSRVDAALGSRVGALADCGLRTGWCSAPRHASRVAPCRVEPSAATLVATGCDMRNGKAAGPIRRGSCSTAVVIGRRRPPRDAAAYRPAIWVRQDVEAQVVLAGHPPPLALAAWNPWSTRWTRC